jgi:AcrR family transcriptional regulator
MPRPFTEEERARIRSRLIEAGKRAINRSGSRSLVVDDIARDAGISKGSFYSFFPSREDFILSVFEAWEVEHRGTLLRSVIEGPGGPRERLERFFTGAFEILDREPGLAKLSWGEIERIMEALPPERLAAHQAADKEELGAAFAQWAARGDLDPADLASLDGLGQMIFSIAMHKDDFRPGTYGPAARLLSEALALRLTTRRAGGSTDAGGGEEGGAR